MSVHIMKVYRGCRFMTTLSLHRNDKEECGRLHASTVLLHRKERRYTLAGRGNGPRANVNSQKYTADA